MRNRIFRKEFAYFELKTNLFFFTYDFSSSRIDLPKVVHEYIITLSYIFNQNFGNDRWI